MESEGLLSYSQQPTIGLCPDPIWMQSKNLILYFFTINLDSNLQSTPSLLSVEFYDVQISKHHVLKWCVCRDQDSVKVRSNVIEAVLSVLHN